MADPVLKTGMSNEEWAEWKAFVTAKIDRALQDAQAMRPYYGQKPILDALRTPGGDWLIVAKEGAVTRSITWRGKEVALVNPRGDFDDHTERQVAGGLGRTPIMDYALRSIIALSKDSANLDLIRLIAVTAIEHVESSVCDIPEEDEG